MKPIFITDEGKKLIAAAVGGEDPVNFTGIRTYDQEKKIAQSAPISGISRTGELCEVFGIIDNSEVREGYFIQGLGLFAQSGEGEILFGFCEEDSDPFYMPAGSENSRTEVTLRISLTSDCTDKIVLSPNSGAYASAALLHEEIGRLDDAITKRTDGGIADLSSRLEVLETVLLCEPMAYSTAVAFNDLDGVEFDGIWNFDLKRIEF